MPKSNKILLISLMLLTACAALNDTVKQPGCSSDFVMVHNRKTGKYDCVSKVEWEHIYSTYDEENWR